MSEAEATNQDMSQLDADQLAAFAGQASDEQLGELMQSEHRKTVLDEIFRRMAEHLNADAASNVEAVIHFKILDRPDGGYDHYEVVLDNGTCTTTDSPANENARVTFKVPPVDFLKLVSGTVSGPQLFMTGSLKIEGDLMFSAQVAGLFKVPRPQTG